MRTRDLAMSTQRIIGVLCCLTFLRAALIRPGFDESECQGAKKIYDELGCSPVYRKNELACPFRYNCNHIKRRSPEKCYIGDAVYEIGEKLASEYTFDACTTCICEKGEGVASFQCLTSCCFPQVKKGCYLQMLNASQCCPGPEICPESPEDIPTCQLVDGTLVQDGDFFQPPGDTKTICYCAPGWQGKYEEPFCMTSKKTDCNIDLNHGGEIKKKCAPIYGYNQSPQIHCSWDFRCQNSKDVIVIPQKFSPSFTRKARCIFGNLKVRIGHRLDRSSYYRSTGHCMDCVCDCPPFLTCRRLESNDLCEDNADII